MIISRFRQRISKAGLLKGVCLATLLFFSQLAMAQENRHHLVRPGQTLYSISKKYEVTVEDILAANPSIVDITAVPTGTLLTIPPAGYALKKPAAPKNTTPAAQSGNTPAAQKPQPTLIEQLQNAWGRLVGDDNDNASSGYRKGTKEIIVSVVLPFNLEARNQEDKKYQARSVEFYQGLLMAVDKMQKKGHYITVKTFDLGTQSMTKVLSDDIFGKSDLIIGPMDQSDISALATYGDEHSIPVVSPFAYSADFVGKYKNLIQLISPKAQLYPQLCYDLSHRFEDYTFVFLCDSLVQGHDDGLVAPLRTSLQQRGIKSVDFNYGHNTIPVERVDSILGIDNPKVVYVPTCTQKNTIHRLLPALKNQLAYQKEAGLPTEDHILLGYPEWQGWTSDMISDYYDLNVYMFSKLYINPFDDQVKAFYEDFNGWYHKDLMNIVPKYGILGYDVAYYFLMAMHDHGQSFMNYMTTQKVQTLQTVIRIEHAPQGGYVNHGLYLVHFRPDSKIEKYEVD